MKGLNVKKVHGSVVLRILFICGAVLLGLIFPAIALGQVGGVSYPPAAFQRSMVFVDGTNLYYRLEEMKLVVTSFFQLFEHLVGGRWRPEIKRIYWYTIEEKYQRVLKVHGARSLDKLRVVKGTGVIDRGTDPKEKGVDALLVADLIYHAAMKNTEYAHLVSIDLDFEYAIRRVEDFGCRSSVLAIGHEAPDRLRDSCDVYRIVTKDELIKSNLASIREK